MIYCNPQPPKSKHKYVLCTIATAIHKYSSDFRSEALDMINQCEKYRCNFRLEKMPRSRQLILGWKNFFSIALFHNFYFAYFVLNHFWGCEPSL